MFLYFVAIFSLMRNANGQEPKSCSQFHYVDKLLDKMIRMEIKVETYDREIAKTNTEIETALEELKREREAFKNDIKEIQKQFKVDMETIKDSLVTPNVIFKARNVKEKSLEADQAIVFTDTMFNYGDGYDNTTGVFTSPVSGTYFFSFHLCVSYSKNMYYGIVLNNAVQKAGRFYDKDATMCFTVDEMIPMLVGHKMWIKCLHSTSNLNESTNYRNTISGMLVHK